MNINQKPINDLNYNDKVSYPVSSLFFLIGFLFIFADCIFYNRIVLFAKEGGFSLFFWPSEIWFIGLGAFIFLSSFVINETVKIPKNPAVFIILLVFVFSLLNGIINNNQFALYDFREFVFGIFCLPAVLLLAPNFKVGKYLKIIIYFTTFFALLIAIISFYESNNLIIDQERLTSNAASRILLFIVSVSLLSFAYGKKKYALPLILCSIAVLLNFSKVTLANFIFTIFCTLTLYFYFDSKSFSSTLNFRNLKLIVFTIFILFFGLVFILAFDILTDGYVQYVITQNFIKERISSGGEIYYGDISGGRLDIWKASFQLWLEKPLLGHGLGKTVEVYSSGWGDKFQLHNAIFQLLQNTGLIGIILIFFAWLYWAKSTIPRIKSIVDLNTKIIFSSMIVFVLTTLFYGLFGHPLSESPLSILFWICVGFLTTVRAKKQL